MSEKPESMSRIDLPVTGMSCASCAANIEKGLSALDGVESASVNFAAEKATVLYDTTKVTVDSFVKAVKDLGYGVSVSKIALPIKGMSCASCVETVQRTLGSLNGVISASVNFATEKATVEYFPSQVGVRDFKKAIRDAGYDLVEPEKGEDVVETEQREREASYRALRTKVITGALLTVPLLILMQWDHIGLSRLLPYLSGRTFFFNSSSKPLYSFG